MQMKLIPIMLLAGCLTALAETEEQINKRFPVQPGGKLVVDVDFGSIDISTNATSEVTVDIVRKVSRRNKASEEEFLRERPVTFSQDGNTLTIQSRAKGKISWSWRGSQRTEGKYTITVPAQFNPKLKTSGGGAHQWGWHRSIWRGWLAYGRYLGRLRHREGISRSDSGREQWWRHHHRKRGRQSRRLYFRWLHLGPVFSAVVP